MKNKCKQYVVSKVQKRSTVAIKVSTQPIFDPKFSKIFRPKNDFWMELCYSKVTKLFFEAKYGSDLIRVAHYSVTLGLGLQGIWVWHFTMWISVLLLKVTWQSVTLQYPSIQDQASLWIAIPYIYLLYSIWPKIPGF